VRLLAVDPGETTGFALFDTESGESYFWAEPSAMDAVTYVNGKLHDGELEVLIVERFTISSRTVQATRGGSNTAIEIIGALRWLAHTYSNQHNEDGELRKTIPFVVQSPSDAKAFVTDEKLKRLGWYTPGKDHARDATRHLVTYMVRNGLLEPSSLLSSAEEEVAGGSS